ncbi:hypothetical protein ACIRL0_29710 [Streptomyces sp. NPDC102365]|uniref:hypothetical protein n=1 Tax=Streptomyces sp. NPDC102365 TaxID=3366162 RepID=UPI0038103066
MTTYRPKAAGPHPAPAAPRESRTRTAHDGISRTAAAAPRPAGRTARAAHPARPDSADSAGAGRSWAVPAAPGGYARAKGVRP